MIGLGPSVCRHLCAPFKGRERARGKTHINVNCNLIQFTGDKEEGESIVVIEKQYENRNGLSLKILEWTEKKNVCVDFLPPGQDCF